MKNKSDASAQTDIVVCLVRRQARISVVAFLAVALTLVLLAADRMHNLTCVLWQAHWQAHCALQVCSSKGKQSGRGLHATRSA